MVNPLEDTFPGLARGGYTITSPRAKGYNCIAGAASDVGRYYIIRRAKVPALAGDPFGRGGIAAGTWSELLNDKALSRITDQEMKELMLFACEHVERLLRLKESDPQEYDLFVKSYNFRYCRTWER